MSNEPNLPESEPRAPDMPPASMPSASASQSGSNDQLLGALTYPIPIIGIVILLSDSMKNNPFLRLHAVQSLALGAVLFVLSFIIGLIPIVGCFVPLLWLGVTIYYAYQAYQNKPVNIPLVTEFCRNQKWI